MINPVHEYCRTVVKLYSNLQTRNCQHGRDRIGHRYGTWTCNGRYTKIRGHDQTRAATRTTARRLRISEQQRVATWRAYRLVLHELYRREYRASAPSPSPHAADPQTCVPSSGPSRCSSFLAASSSGPSSLRSFRALSCLPCSKKACARRRKALRCVLGA